MSDEAKRFAFPGAPVRRCPQCLDEALNNWNGPRFFPATFVGYGGDADQKGVCMTGCLVPCAGIGWLLVGAFALGMVSGFLAMYLGMRR